MNILTVNDLEHILSLAVKENCGRKHINHIKTNIIIINEKLYKNRALTQDEITALSTNKKVKFMMILFFLTKNASLEFIRRNEELYASESVQVNKLWQHIELTIKKKLLLSREIGSQFKHDFASSSSLSHFVNAAQSLEFTDLAAEEFISNVNNSIFRLYVTKKYELIKGISSNNSIQANKEHYTLHDRKTCFHEGLYDPFKFEESQTWVSKRYLNTSPTRKLIDSVFTVQFALPELTVLYTDNTYTKVFTTEIPDFLEKNLISNEITSELYQAIKNDYPKLFLSPLDYETVTRIYKSISQLITHGIQQAAQVNKPLLILLSEVHGSKESFFFHTIILHCAKSIGVRHLLVETINIYHEQYGWDAQVNEIKRLISFAQNKLGFQVKDLEQELHYKNRLCPYPYHDIPEPHFGIDAREASWIIDAKKINKNQIMIVGSGHLNNLLNSSLQDNYHILPIDCSGDKEFSDMLSITQHHFISLDKSVNQFTLDEMIKMVQEVSLQHGY